MRDRYSKKDAATIARQFGSRSLPHKTGGMMVLLDQHDAILITKENEEKFDIYHNADAKEIMHMCQKKGIIPKDIEKFEKKFSTYIEMFPLFSREKITPLKIAREFQDIEMLGMIENFAHFEGVKIGKAIEILKQKDRAREKLGDAIEELKQKPNQTPLNL